MADPAEPDLDATQVERYARHLVLEDVGPEGQGRLLDAGVLVVGAGGLGAPAIQYLAAAGVGRLGIVDDDAVERSNLQRQVIHGESDVGRPKVESAAEFVAERNPDVTVEPHGQRLDADSAELVSEYEFVVDATDNFPTRYLVNDACTLAGVPFAHGAVDRFYGQAATFAHGGPCYRCLLPEAPPAGAVPDCASAGVLGVLPGTIGTIEATEAVKWLLGVGDPLVGRLLVYDARELTAETVTVRRDPECPVCGDDPEIESVDEVAYEGACAP